MANENSSHLTFFWERKRHPTRSRFNLLLLEYGEYFFEDLSVYLFPLPSEHKPFHQCDALKVQGRMKLCSRSIIFEPTDQRKPIIKYLFRSFKNPVEQYYLNKIDRSHCSVEVSGFFAFRCSGTVEMMDNGRVGPYRLVDFANKEEGATILFASVHSEITSVINNINQLYHLYQTVERDGIGLEFLSKLALASTTSFDTSQLLDFHEGFLLSQSVPVKKIRPLIINPGCLMVTDRRVYYQPAQLNNVGDPVQHYDFNKISRIYRRRYLLRHTSLELIMTDGTSAFFCFENRSSRDEIYHLLLQTLSGGGPPSSSSSGASSSVQRRGSLNLQRKSLDTVVRQWQRREISNFEYLMYLNNEADRSMNDLTQYPVFPHILQDFKSRSLDLKNPNTFRDLSKPIGALNASRLEHFKARYHSMPARDDSAGIPPPFLYGTHYSTPGYVLHFLVRSAPEYMLCLQNGKFDAPDRSFLSISESWDSCLNNPADLKELIPEFFVGNGDFLVNNDDLDLGHRYNGERLNDVDLPPWAKSSRDFIRKHAKALESEYVSNHLHEWIDLIFGYKQQGPEAVANNNVFYYLTYEGAVDLEKESDPRRKRALEMQIQEFGQTPKQLFAKPHPMRGDHSAEILLCPDEFVPGTSSGSASSGSGKKSNRSGPGGGGMESKGSENSIRGLKGSNDSPGIATLTLGDDFKVEVDREMRKSDPPLRDSSVPSGGNNQSGLVGTIFGAFSSPKIFSGPGSSPSPAPVAAAAAVSSAASTVPSVRPSENSKIASASLLSSDSKGPNSKPVATAAVSKSSTVTAALPMEPSDNRKVRSLRSLTDPFNAHTESVMGVFLSLDTSPVLCTCSKDSFLKVLQLDSTDTSALQVSVRRCFKPSDPNPVSACCVSKDGQVVYAACYDNVIYSYSILNACIVGRLQAHDDSVTSLDIDRSGKWLVSGSWDASVKVWKISEDGGELEGVLELYEHETPVISVAINDANTFVAAGAEDGSLVVWSINCKTRQSSVAFTKLISTAARRPLTSLRWIPSSNISINSQVGFSADKLVCGTGDGLLVCLDVTGKLFAATKVQPSPDAMNSVPFKSNSSVATNAVIGVNCLSIDKRGNVYGGCEDKTIRVWCMEKGYLKELYIQNNVNNGGVTATSLNQDHSIIVSGGEDGTVSAWRIELE